MKLAIMCGIPLSGKSTFARKLQHEGWVRVSPDDIRLALHGKQFVAKVEPLVWRHAQLSVRSLLIGGHQVLVDATNITKSQRGQWITIAAEFDLPLKIYVTDSDLEVSLQRNRELQRLPEDVVHRMFKQYQAPAASEGEITFCSDCQLSHCTIGRNSHEFVY